MKKNRFTESQIVVVLEEGEAGMPVAELCRKHGVSNATYCQWKSKYSGVQVPELQRLRVWRLRMPSSNAYMQSGAGKCSD
jgi:putative transposase